MPYCSAKLASISAQSSRVSYHCRSDCGRPLLKSLLHGLVAVLGREGDAGHEHALPVLPREPHRAERPCGFLTEEERDLILGGNAERIFKI